MINTILKKVSLYLLITLIGSISLGGCLGYQNPPPIKSPANQTTPIASSSPTPALTSAVPTLTVTNTRRPSSTPQSTFTPTSVPIIHYFTSTNIFATLNTEYITPSDEVDGVYVEVDGTIWYGFIDISDPYNEFGPEYFFGAGADMFRKSFANFYHMIAYVDFDGNFFIADIVNRHPILILSDPLAAKSEVTLIWTPDDQHLILDFEKPEHQDMIFHLLSGEWDVWDYICDRLAISPHTQRVATWCISTEENKFLVFEWGGEFWYSDFPPEKQLLHVNISRDPNKSLSIDSFFLFHVAGWSANGERIAYYDPGDESGSLKIINALGESQLEIPSKAYWLTSSNKAPISLLGHPLQWSESGSRILILGIGSPDKPCPEQESPLGNGEILLNPECWQVVDSISGEVIWQTSDLREVVKVGLFRNIYQAASISNDGRYITLFTYSPTKSFYIVDIETREILLYSPLETDMVHWGPRP